MEITLSQLMHLMTRAIDAGVQQYAAGIDPRSDNISQADAKRCIKRYGYPSTMLKKWVSAGLLTPIKTGTRQNAQVLYSLAQLKRVISTLTLKDTINMNIPKPEGDELRRAMPTVDDEES